MYTSMKQRVGSKANLTQGIHIDFGGIVKQVLWSKRE